MANKNFKVKNGIVASGDITTSGSVYGLANLTSISANYSLISGDNGKIFYCTNSAQITITLSNDSVLPIGTQVLFIQAGSLTGNILFSPDTGVTVNGTPKANALCQTRSQWSTATAIKVDTNTWIIAGDLI